jgi:hypothetical protein
LSGDTTRLPALAAFVVLDTPPAPLIEGRELSVEGLEVRGEGERI